MSGFLEPFICCLVGTVIAVIPVFFHIGGIDNAGNVAGTTQQETFLTFHQLKAFVSGFPGRNMIFQGGDKKSGNRHLCDVNGDVIEQHFTRFDQVIMQIHPA